MIRKIFIITFCFVLLGTMQVLASSPACSNSHSSIEEHITNVYSILGVLSSDISSNSQVAGSSSYTLENIVLEVRGTISPVMGTAGGVSDVVFDHLVTGGGSDFLDSFTILFRPYPIPRDWTKLSLIKQDISQALLDVGFADLLEEEVEASTYIQKFDNMPVNMIAADDYGDIVDALWINHMAMEKIFMKATSPDLDQSKADIKDSISSLIVREQKGRELRINPDYFEKIDEIHEYYADSQTCLPSWEKFMESLEKLKNLSTEDYEEITTRFSDSYKRLKDALKLGNHDSDYEERKKQLLRDYMNKTTSLSENNYREGQRNSSIADLMKDRVGVSGRGFEEIRNFGDETTSITDKLKGDVGAFLAGDVTNEDDLRRLMTLECEAIVDKFIKELCEEKEDNTKNSGVWKENDKINTSINIIQSVQIFNNAFTEEYISSKILLGEGGTASVNGVTKGFPIISKKIRESIDLVNENDQIYTNLVEACHNQCLNIEGKCEPEGEGNN